MSVDTDVVLDEKIKIKNAEPSKFKVIFLNDDTTPMDFVIEVLIEIYKHTEETAAGITIEIHTEGSGVVGFYTHEIAEQKEIDTTKHARNHGFQLQVRLEAE